MTSSLDELFRNYSVFEEALVVVVYWHFTSKAIRDEDVYPASVLEDEQ